MSEQETTLLKSENSRLSRLVEALLSANEDLRQQNADLRTGNASPDFGSSVTENGNGTKSIGSSVTENGNGTKGIGLPVTENSNGIKYVSLPITENSKETKDFGLPITENSNGIADNLAPLPEKIDLTSNAFYYVATKLRTGQYTKAKESGVQNQAKLLVHFHNGGGGSYPELRKLTGFSKGGLGKSLGVLTKRGLISRTGFQKFGVTAAGKKVLQLGWDTFSRVKPTATNS